MQDYYDAMKKKHQSDATDHALEAAKDAAIWGGVAGSASRLLNGGRSLPGILMRGLGSAAISGAAGGGAEYLGEKLMGPKSDEDTAGYTQRGALGGGVGGGLLGGGLGYLIGGGKLNGLSKIPGALRAAELVKNSEALPLDNMVIDRLKKHAMNPSHAGGLEGGLMLGGIGALLGSMHGASEGMVVDAAHNSRLNEDEDGYR